MLFKITLEIGIDVISRFIFNFKKHSGSKLLINIRKNIVFLFQIYTNNYAILIQNEENEKSLYYFN